MLQALRHILLQRTSIAALWLIAIFFFGTNFAIRRWSNDNIMRQDVIQYYAYLPAAFVHQDLGMTYSNFNGYYSDKVWGVSRRPGMGPVQKYTMGMAVMYSPFFAIAHIHAKLGGWTADGYTRPYRMWLQLGMTIYLILGLAFLRKLLLHHFSERSTALTLLALALGTNLFYYVIGDPGMPHTAVFMLVSMLMWITHRIHTAPTWRNAALLGTLLGLIALIRPNNLLLTLVPLLHGLDAPGGWQAKRTLIRQHAPKIAIIPLIMALMAIPQLLYWKHLTGQWLYYSYQDEGFFFTKPAIWQVLFSFRKGLFIYTPLMLLGFIGLIWLRRMAPGWLTPVAITVAACGYVIASWWCWWYGGSFGMRAFVDLFPLLAMGMAATYERLGAGLRWARTFAIGTIVAALCLLNGFQTLQYSSTLIHYDGMTWQAYKGVFGKLSFPPGYDQWIDAPDYEAAKRGQR